MEGGPFRSGELRVVSFRGREELSRPYRWDVVCEVEGIDFDALEVELLGQSACLDFTLANSAPRIVHGVISSLRRDDASTDGLSRRIKLRLSPRLALLSRNRVSRIFQDTSVPEIVREVLGEAGIPVEMRLTRRCPPRVYCVQYQESDLEFVTRLLAEDGVFYFFRQPPVMLSDTSAQQVVRELAASTGSPIVDLGEIVVLADDPGAYLPIAPRGPVGEALPVGPAPTLVYHFGDGAVPDEHHVCRLTRKRAVRSQAVLVRDHDFRNPALDLTAAESASAVSPSGVGDLRRRDFREVLADTISRQTRRAAPLGALQLGVDPTRLTVYEHHGEDEDPEVSRAAAHVRFEQVRRRAITAEGESWCRRLSAGSRFRVDNHPDNELNAEYAAVSVQHVGRTSGHQREGAERASYQNKFSCVPAKVPYRPQRAPRVHRQVLETARVVGPPSEEIYTDAHGRIKVQFHWDLAGYNDERSSCWVRVNQAWAGPQWGTQFIPRVGMEVLVSFLGGDQDRPVVLGCLYTGENTPSFAVPGDRTRSGIRTQSSPGGGGHNELSFEDAKGAEQVYLHAERNLDEVVRHDHSVHVGRDEATTIARHQRTSVHGDQHQEIQGDRVAVLGGNDGRSVVGDSHTSVEGEVAVSVGAKTSFRLDGIADISIAGNANIAVRRSLNMVVGTKGIAGGGSIWSLGDQFIGAANLLSLNAEKELRLQCGESSIVLTPDEIRLEASRLRLFSCDCLEVISDKGSSLVLSDSVEAVGDAVKVSSRGAMIELSDSAVRVLADKIQFDTSDSADARERKKLPVETKPLKLKLTDERFQPYASRPYEVIVRGVRLSGTTSSDGELNEQIPKDSAEARVVLWIGQPPNGRCRTWTVELVESLPPASTVEGAIERLRNLGYLSAEGTSIGDDLLRLLVEQFQVDHGLQVTGEKDDISSMLERVHGS